MRQAHSSYLISAFFLFGIFFALPFFVLSNLGAAWLYLLQTSFVFFFTGTALLLYLWGSMCAGAFRLRMHPLVVAGITLLLSALFSLLFSKNKILSLFGEQYEVGSFVVLLFAVLLFFLASQLFNRALAARALVFLVLAVVLAAMINVLPFNNTAEENSPPQYSPSFGELYAVSATLSGESTTRAFVGGGQNTFPHIWLLYRSASPEPLLENESDVKRHFFAALSVEQGLFGVLSWLFFFSVFLFFWLRELLRTIVRVKDAYFPFAALSLALFSWVLFILDGANTFLFILAFTLSGMAAGLSSRAKRVRDVHVPNHPLTRLLVRATLILFFAGFTVGGYLFTKDALASFYLQKARSFAPIANTEKAVSLSSRAYHLAGASEMYFEKAKADYANGEARTAQWNIRSGAQHAREAIERNPLDYRPRLLLGRIDAFEVQTTGVRRRTEEMKQSYLEAALRNPQSAPLALEVGYMYLLYGDLSNARESAERALSLTAGDFPEAQTFLDDVSVF